MAETDTTVLMLDDEEELPETRSSIPDPDNILVEEEEKTSSIITETSSTELSSEAPGGYYKDTFVSSDEIFHTVATETPHLSRPARVVINENKTLRKQLLSKRAEVFQLKREMANMEKLYKLLLSLEGFPHRVKDVMTTQGVISQIVTLTNENRALHNEVSRLRLKRKTEKDRAVKPVRFLQEAEKEILHPSSSTSSKKTSILKPSLTTINEEQYITAYNKNLLTKLNKTERRLYETKNKCHELDRELKFARKALKKEVGCDMDVSEILKGKSNWRGREQRIFMLKRRMLAMQARFRLDLLPTGEPYDIMKFPSVMPNERHVANLENIIKERRLKYETTEKELKEATAELKRHRNKLHASYARSLALEYVILEMRKKMEDFKSKSEHDERLIDVLTKERNHFELRMYDGKQDAWKEARKVKELAKENAHRATLFRSKVKNLEESLQGKQNHLEKLEEMLRELKEKMSEENIVPTVPRCSSEPILTDLFDYYLKPIKTQPPAMDPAQRLTASEFFHMLKIHRKFCSNQTKYESPPKVTTFAKGTQMPPKVDLASLPPPKKYLKKKVVPDSSSEEKESKPSKDIPKLPRKTLSKSASEKGESKKAVRIAMPDESETQLIMTSPKGANTPLLPYWKPKHPLPLPPRAINEDDLARIGGRQKLIEIYPGISVAKCVPQCIKAQLEDKLAKVKLSLPSNIPQRGKSFKGSRKPAIQ